MLRLFGPCQRSVLIAAVLLAVATPAHATLLIADFNDLTLGAISGQGGGTGFTGNWSGSAAGYVVSGDLSSSLYGITTPSGTPQHIQNANAAAPALRQDYRTPATSPTGTVWFSFLASVVHSGDRAGLSFNSPTASPFNDPGTVYAYLNGTSLNYSFGSGTAGSVATSASLGSTVLVVGKMTIVGSSGLDSIQLWVNPDLIANPDINAYTPVYTSTSSVNFIDTISRIGAIAAQVDGGTGGSGNVDNIRISDGGGSSTQAYFDVVGVPEPSTVVLLALAAASCLAYCWRRRRPAA